MTYTYILKQLSYSNWNFEWQHCEDMLSEFIEEFELEVGDYPAGKNNKNKNSGKTLVAVFEKEASNKLIAELRWRVHTRFK